LKLLNIYNTAVMLVFIVLVLTTRLAFAHGDVKLDNDVCVIHLGPFNARLTGYQGDNYQTTRFCEDMPQAGGASFTIEELNNAFTDMEVEMFVFKGKQNLTDKTKYSDINNNSDIKPRIISHVKPVYQTSPFSVSVTLKKGNYVGLVRMRNPHNAQMYVAEFPFSVAMKRKRPTPTLDKIKVEAFCPASADKSWRKQQSIEGVNITASQLCLPDNPYEVAAFVKGTNNVSHATLMKTLLSPDSVIKGKDLDNDGDPDEIHIRLEVVELNGKSPDEKMPVTTYDIAPGINPGFWAFAPKSRGMATKNFKSSEANSILRMPSPSLRVEQGDRVKITLENTHYMPHTIHLHGVDHPFVKANGEGNDGVPQTSEPMVMPGESRTYEIQPRQPGTNAYHCHVQPGTHVLMGLIGMFIVEENRPNNTLQTINVGAGHVRRPSVAVLEKYQREYDLHYIDADNNLHNIVKTYNNPAIVAQEMNRRYSLTSKASGPDLFMLNGKSFPYTLRESLVVVKPDENIKLRVINAGQHAISLHTHGHKPTVTHYDGVKLNPTAEITRDVFFISSAQRNDLKLETTNDGLHSYGEGIWLFHDHNELGITTNGMMPGGGVSAIVYESWLTPEGKPKAQGVDLRPYFTRQYYRGELPVWGLSNKQGQLKQQTK